MSALGGVCPRVPGVLGCRSDGVPSRPMRRGPFFIALLLAGSCRGGASPVQGKDMPQPAVRFETSRGPWVVQVELARTDEQRARGLMFRRDLPRDDGRVVGVVKEAEPRTDTPRRVGKPSRYIVEVAGGEAAAHAVVPGTRAV